MSKMKRLLPLVFRSVIVSFTSPDGSEEGMRTEAYKYLSNTDFPTIIPLSIYFDRLSVK